MKKYGMAFHSIRYWQTQAWGLYCYNGIISGLSIWNNPGRIDQMSARDIGHAAIGLAYVHAAFSYYKVRPLALAEKLRSLFS